LHAQVISEVLAEYGDNIDAAIKHLNELQLSAPGTSKQHEEQNRERQGIIGPASTSAEGTVPAAARPEPQPHLEQTRTADQWIELLVQQMTEAGDIEDAKLRAAEVLRAFEQAVSRQSAGDVRIAEVEKENTILKRAVAIQNARIQELGVKEAEVLGLRGAVDAAKTRIQTLEMQNYSLQVHLKQATDSQDMHHMSSAPKNPDVF